MGAGCIKNIILHSQMSWEIVTYICSSSAARQRYLSVFARYLKYKKHISRKCHRTTNRKL